jgi:hypothetical protein
MVREYSKELGFEIGAHSLRATAATNALDHQADIAKVQEWLGHANISTTRIYDHRKTRPEDRGGSGFSDTGVSGVLSGQYSNRRADIHEKAKT